MVSVVMSSNLCLQHAPRCPPHAPHRPPHEYTQESQLCGLGVLSSLAAGCDGVSAQLLIPGMLLRLQELIRNGDPSVRQAALFALSNLSFCRDNKVRMRV